MSGLNNVGKEAEDLITIQVRQGKRARQRVQAEAKKRADRASQTDLVNELQGVSDPTSGHFCD